MIGDLLLAVCRINVEFILIAVGQKNERNTELLPANTIGEVCLEIMFHSIFLKCLFKNKYFVPEKGNIGCPNPLRLASFRHLKKTFYLFYETMNNR